MKLSLTAALSAAPEAPVVLRGDYERMIEIAARFGYDGIELHTEEPEKVDREKLGKLLDRYGIGLIGLGTGGACGKWGIFLASEEKEVRGRAVAYLKRHMDLAHDLGGVVIIGLIKGKISQCGSRERYFRFLNESMEECVAYAESRDVTLVMEMINRYESDVLNTIAEGLDYIGRFDSKRLMLHLDTFHMNLEERDIGKAILSARGRIGHVHGADSDRWYAGHGHYDFEETFAALKEAGYDGAFSMECLCRPDQEITAEKSMETLRRFV